MQFGHVTIKDVDVRMDMVASAAQIGYFCQYWVCIKLTHKKCNESEFH